MPNADPSCGAGLQVTPNGRMERAGAAAAARAFAAICLRSSASRSAASAAAARAESSAGVPIAGSGPGTGTAGPAVPEAQAVVPMRESTASAPIGVRRIRRKASAITPQRMLAPPPAGKESCRGMGPDL